MTDETKKPATAKKLEIDHAMYDEYLADADLSEEERRAVLEALWSIIVSFVDLGWEVHPVSETCGKSAESEDHRPQQEADVVRSKAVSKTPNEAIATPRLQAKESRP